MNEGRFLKLPTEETGKMYVRKGEGLPLESFDRGFDKLQEEIISQSSPEALKVKNFEIEKTEKDEENITRSIEGVKDVLMRFGGEVTTLSHSLVHLVRPEYFGRKSGELIGTDGEYNVRAQFVVVLRDDYTTHSKLTVSSFHELVHLVSFQRSGVLKNKEKSDGVMKRAIERNGFDINDKKDSKNILFYYLTEMVVEQLTKEFTEKIRGEEPFKEEFDYVESQLADRDIERPFGGYMERGQNDAGQEVWHLGEAYKAEVKKFQEILSEIVSRNSEFASTEEVFDFFARGLFSGRLLKIARLLEKTYGKGAFRDLGEMTAHYNNKI